MKNKVILIDCDGVVLDWETKFIEWMALKGFHPIAGRDHIYKMKNRFGLEGDIGDDFVEAFNTSAWVGFMPALRDAKDYLSKLAADGYRFVCLTSVSLDPYAGKLRKQNLENEFGEIFDDVICLGCGASKDDALYELSIKYPEAYWVEDNIHNVDAGINVGLKGILVGHAFNAKYTGDAVRVNTWKEIYDIVTEN